MDALPQFDLVRPRTLDELIAARAGHAESSLLGGGTDLVVNIRRGIVAPPVLIDVNGVSELRAIKADAHTLEIGAAVTLADLAEHPDVVRHYPVVAQAAAHIAGPTHRANGHGRRQSLSGYALHLLQSERMVARRQPSLPEDDGHDLPRRAEEPRRLFRHLQRRPGAGAADARRRDRHCGPERPPHDAARRRVYRLCKAGRAGDGDAGRRQIFPVASPG